MNAPSSDSSSVGKEKANSASTQKNKMFGKVENIECRPHHKANKPGAQGTPNLLWWGKFSSAKESPPSRDSSITSNYSSNKCLSSKKKSNTFNYQVNLPISSLNQKPTTITIECSGFVRSNCLSSPKKLKPFKNMGGRRSFNTGPIRWWITSLWVC